MASTDIHPLLVDGRSQSNVPKKTHKGIKCTARVLIGLLLIGIVIVILYATSTWPFEDNATQFVGAVGKYPLHGGNKENQQISLNSKITKDNINSVQRQCLFNSSDPTGFAFTGYITIDDQERAFFADSSGHIKCFDVSTCLLIWNVNITDIIGIPFMESRNTLSLFQNNNGQKGVLFGTPNTLTSRYVLDPKWECWVVALDINNGNEMWKTLISDTGSCLIHGLQIDNGFAYGGTSSLWILFPPDSSNIHIGKAFKIDINTGEMVLEWQTLPPIENQTDDIELELYYSGASIWPIQSVIDDYFVFGTGNLFTYPFRVEECMLGNTDEIPEDSIRPNNPCGEDKREYLHWRCFEDGHLYPSSLIILNKHTFEIQSSISFAGVDTWNEYCYYLNSTQLEEIPECTSAYNGPDADAVAVAAYHFNGDPYVAVGAKSGELHIVQVPNGELKVTTKIGPWSEAGGISPFGMAVDEKNLIGIAALRGRESPVYRYAMADGTVLCDTGSVHVIDLKTGYTMWQWIHPYGKSGINECNATVYDEYFDTTVPGSCQRSFDGSAMLPPNITLPLYNGTVVTPPIDDLIEPINAESRSLIIGPVTISNDMIFIPTITGEVFVHDIFNGDYIATFQCPDYFMFDIYSYRHGIRSGVTLYDDKLMFYCGADSGYPPYSLPYGQIVVMSLAEI